MPKRARWGASGLIAAAAASCVLSFDPNVQHKCDTSHPCSGTAACVGGYCQPAPDGGDAGEDCCSSPGLCPAYTRLGSPPYSRGALWIAVDGNTIYWTDSQVPGTVDAEIGRASCRERV